jgi:serine protease Do
MNRINRIIAMLGLGILAGVAPLWISTARADLTTDPTQFSRKMYDDKKDSLVAVKYTWEWELGSQDLVAAGIVVGDDGLVMIPIATVTPNSIPLEQMKDFKIIVPSMTEDETEIDATLEGRDERTNVAFVRAKTPQKWKSIKFVDAPMEIGDMVYSVGLLPKGAGYKAHATMGMISARLRGPVPQVLVEGDLASVGAPVFNAKGEAIGMVHPRSMEEALLDNPQAPDDMPMVTSPPKLFIPMSDYAQSLDNPPVAGKTDPIPWLGAIQMKGLDKEFAEFFDLKNTPAVQIGDVVKDSPADKAGLKTLDVIVKMDEKGLERGDLPIELPQILNRKIQRMKVGDKVTFSVIHQKGEPPKDITVTLEERPRQPLEAHRFYAKDLGFVAREVVFVDTYRRKLPQTATGVVVAMLRPNAAAAAAKLQVNDLVTQMNGKPITDLDTFKKEYQQFRKDKPHDPVVFEVSQLDGKQQTINIEPPQSGTVPGAGAGQ